MKNRRYAHPLDRPVVVVGEGPHGVDASPDAIGGYYGIGWYQYYRDRETPGEVYSVHCTDGVNGGYGPYSDEDAKWQQDCFYAIVRRVLGQPKNTTLRWGARKVVEAGDVKTAKEIQLSTNEWSIMLCHVRGEWLDEGDDPRIEEGLIGHCKGVPVVVTSEKADEFPPRKQKKLESQSRESANPLTFSFRDVLDERK